MWRVCINVNLMNRSYRLQTCSGNDWLVDWLLQIEREKRRADRLQQITEAQTIIEGADMDG